MASVTLIKTTKIIGTLAQQVVGISLRRNYLLIINCGAADLEYGFDSSLVVGTGVVLSPGGMGKQGGYMIWDGNSIPTNPIYAISAAGSTIVVLEG